MEFRIKALDQLQGVVSCVMQAVDEPDLRRQLALRDLKVISLAPIRRPRLLRREGRGQPGERLGRRHQRFGWHEARNRHVVALDDHDLTVACDGV